MERLSSLLLVSSLMAVATSGAATEAGVQQAASNPAGLFNIRPLSIFTGHCNASIARGAAIWKPVPGVVDVFFPKVVSGNVKTQKWTASVFVLCDSRHWLLLYENVASSHLPCRCLFVLRFPLSYAERFRSDVVYLSAECFSCLYSDLSATFRISGCAAAYFGYKPGTMAFSRALS